eukprot:m51a1_g118 putative dna damage-binding protein 1a (1114) ;mRNA; f:362128-365815
MSYNYVVSANRPTAVSRAVVSHFTSPSDTNLILSKGTRLEIHRLAPEGLAPVADVPDDLFVLTERYQCAVLSYDAARSEVVTRASGDVQDRVGRPAEGGHIGIVDPDGRMIALHMYEGFLKIIPISAEGALLEAFNVRLEEIKVVDVQFLHGCSAGRPTIAVLYSDPGKEASRHVRTYEVSVDDRELAKGPWDALSVESTTNYVVPVPKPLCGVVLLGEQTITYHHGDYHKSISEQPACVRAWGIIDADGSRILLGDHSGRLRLLALSHNGARVMGLKVQTLGTTSMASSISYLDSGVVFVGSAFGDSQLVRLTPEPSETGSHVEILASFTNLGPIVDFAAVDADRQGQCQVVTCSGGYKDGSLRVVRNGIGINEQSSVELPGIRGLWSLADPEKPASRDKFLVVSFVGETRVLALESEELAEGHLAGFEGDKPTIWCGNVCGGTRVLQATASGLFLLGLGGGLIDKWAAPAHVTVVSCNGSQVVLSTAGNMLHYLKLSGDKITPMGQKHLPDDVSCIDVGTGCKPGVDSHIVLVGTWTDFCVHVLSLPDFADVHTEHLEGNVVPRSAMLAELEGVVYVLVGLGDGHLVSYVVDQDGAAGGSMLRDRKRVSLGTSPPELRAFLTRGAANIFVASNRPTVIYSSNKKLVYSTVNLKDLTHVCMFRTAPSDEAMETEDAEQASLAIATEGRLVLGTIDEIQKLHIRTVPLGEMPRRIVHQPETSTFAVLTVRGSACDDCAACEGEGIEGEDLHEETSQILLLDEQLSKLDEYRLDQHEMGTSALSMRFTGDEQSYFIVGTAYIAPAEAEPSKGRLLVFRVASIPGGGRKLSLVAEKEVKGAVYSMDDFGGRLLAGVNARVNVFAWSDAPSGGESSKYQKSLTAHCGYHGHILALYVAAVRGDFAVVGDLMKSVSVLAYRPAEQRLEEVARDVNPAWMTAIHALDDDTYIGAENSYNFFVLQRNLGAATEEDRGRLETVAEFHIGEFVNRFRAGSLVSRPDETEAASAPVRTLLFGTVNGVLGVVAQLRKEQFEFFATVEASIRNVIRGIGNIDHVVWRSFSNERRTAPPKGFIDGDLVESFLDLSHDKMAEVVRPLNISVEELSKRIETLQRFLH